MANSNGYVKLYRSFLEWEWYQDVPTKTVFLHLILSANYEEKQWKRMTIHRGEIATSYAQIAEKTGLTYQQARNAVSKLKPTGCITQQTTPPYSLIRIENFEKYQSIGTDKDADNQQGSASKSNSQATTTKEIKNKEYIKEVEIIKEKNKKKESFSVPPEIAEAFSDFREMREKIKAPLTERAVHLIVLKLEKLAPGDFEKQRKILEQSTMQSWRGVFELKGEGGAQNGQAVGASDAETKNLAALVV